MSFFTALLSVLFIITIEGCSGKDPEQPFVIPFDSQYITTDKKLSVMPSLRYKSSSTRHFLSLTQKNYFFKNGNGTAEIEVILNRKAEARIPKIGDWNTVSIGNCLSDSPDVQCFTAHVDCHLVRSSFIKTGTRSIVVIKTRDRAREPQELCEKWDLNNLTKTQLEVITEFNRISDSFFKYDVNILQTNSTKLPNSIHKKRSSNQK